MTDLRTAAQQALEVLESGLLVSHHAQVLIDLRAALAQQAEPVAGNTLLKAFLAAAKEAGVTHLRQVEAVLRAALAQQAEPEEPVAQYSDIVSDGGMDPRNKYDTALPAREWVSMDEYKRLQGLVTSQGIRLMEYESKQPQQAEPEEPVAWRVQRSDGQYEVYLASAERASECYIKRPQIEPLYTAPPQRLPLTEEEINRIDACIDESTPLKEGKRQFARAVEKASWEKNHG